MASSKEATSVYAALFDGKSQIGRHVCFPGAMWPCRLEQKKRKQADKEKGERQKEREEVQQEKTEKKMSDSK